jgi:hypothetical protein
MREWQGEEKKTKRMLSFARGRPKLWYDIPVMLATFLPMLIAQYENLFAL